MFEALIVELADPVKLVDSVKLADPIDMLEAVIATLVELFELLIELVFELVIFGEVLVADTIG